MTQRGMFGIAGDSSIDIVTVQGAGGTLVTTSAGATPSTTATLSNVAGSAASVTLLALNTLRFGFVIVNDSTSILYIKFGSAASATSYSYALGGSVGGVPYQLERAASFNWTGIITGIWVSATGSARVTEMTA